jgi:hypothetical protein
VSDTAPHDAARRSSLEGTAGVADLAARGATSLMQPFLHHRLGIDIVDRYREVRPTWKLGIVVDWEAAPRLQLQRSVRCQRPRASPRPWSLDRPGKTH